ncbi:MAG: alpha/beta hydrolase [Pseudomonadota bacterium]
MEFDAEGEHFSVTGVIDESTPEIFRAITSQHPHIKTLVLQYVEGSVDDDANLEFSRDVRDLGFDTIVPSDGLIASGGTDLFLAGNRRTLESGACVGVHSWGGEGPPAAELPRDHHEHAKYLDYYRDLGVDLEFYWYTLAAAPAAEMHWMSADEADRFGLTTGQSPELGASIVCHGR